MPLQPEASPTGSFTCDAKPSTAPNLLNRHALQSHVPRRADRVKATLTPQFHWNLNYDALEQLNFDESRALYTLFRFYDSSYEGDAVPAIHCHRFLELLRDGQLLAQEESQDCELQVHTVETVFAQAVLGKLRTYLDADDQPALTFELFAGALLNCAMLKYPDVSPPDVAYKQLVQKLLSLEPKSGVLGPSRGLVQHSEQADIPTWKIQDLGHTDDRAADDPSSDYLKRHVFQEVLAGLCHDKHADERLRERLDRLYALPDDLATHFNAETIQYVTDRFRTYDACDKGVLSRDEVFTLLSSMAKKLEITDVSEVLVVILAGELADRKQMPRGSLVLGIPSTVREISLVQLLQALHVCRRSRSASYVSGHQHHNSRKTAAQVSDATSSNESRGTEGKSATQVSPGASSKRGSGDHGSASGRHPRGSKGRVPGAQGKQPLRHQGPTGGHHQGSSKKGVPHQSGQSQATGETAKKKDRKDYHRSGGTETPTTAHDDAQDSLSSQPPLEPTVLERHDSCRSVLSSSSSSSSTVRNSIVRDSVVTRNPYNNDSTQADGEVTTESNPEGTPEAVVVEAALTIQLFDAHKANFNCGRLDGSICYQAQLVLASYPYRVVTSQGVYFETNGNRHEVWDTQTYTVDRRQPPEAAVRLLKRLVDEKEREGFVLIPERQQRDAMNKVLDDLRQAACPIYAAPLKKPELLNVRLTSQPQMRMSLDRGSTWVKQRSSSDLLMALSDSQLQARLKMKKREALAHWNRQEDSSDSSRAAANRLPNRRSAPVPSGYDKMMATWGLQPQDSWVSALNTSRNMVESHSLPSLSEGNLTRSPMGKKARPPLQLEPLDR